MQKPYKYPPKNIVWRLTFDSYINDDDPDQDYEYDFNTRFELISSELTASASKNAQNQSYELPNWKYRCRFIKRPVPIILTDLSESDLSIHGRKTKTECELLATMHSQILQRAVEIATAIYNPQMLGTIAGFGNVSSTNIGVVPTKNDRS